MPRSVIHVVGRVFLPARERIIILENIKMVDSVILFNDNDGSSIEAIKNIKLLFPNDSIVFANGGDRTVENIPEKWVPDVEFAFGIGGDDKKNSSSWILEEWKSPKTIRPWGYYRVLHDVAGTKVKELVVNPGCSLSMQRHNFRSEFWRVAEGSAVVNTMTPHMGPLKETIYKHQSVHIRLGEWHQLTNPFGSLCKIIETQFGENCIEEDIERK